MPRARVLVVVLALAAPARAEVDADHPLVTDTAFTLKAGEWKLGLGTSAVGMSDRLQLETNLVGDLLSFVNVGVKARVVQSRALAVAVGAWTGALLLGPALSMQMVDAGAEASASLPVGERLWLHLTAGLRWWRFGLGDASLGVRPVNLRIAWPTLQAQLEWDLHPRHVFFLTASTKTSWLAESEWGTHDFDATDFWQALIGYQLSVKAFNVRVDAGYGPSLFGRGLTGALDAYLRF